MGYLMSLRDTAGDAMTNSSMIFNGHLQMVMLMLADQQELIYISSVWTGCSLELLGVMHDKDG